MSREEYERLKRRLQIELLKRQNWTKSTGARHVIVFGGRDAAGKGGTIQRFTEHLNPRGAHVVALEKPPNARPRSGTSSATSSTCRPRARWSSSTGPGTTAPASNG
jgi:polyphosphate kinase 2 (PPK2 family)